jgi:transposase InsO family protein
MLNSDQGRQFTSNNYPPTLKNENVRLSTDGKALDSIFMEWFWGDAHVCVCTPEHLCRRARIEKRLGEFIQSYHYGRKPQSLGYLAPANIHTQSQVICAKD